MNSCIHFLRRRAWTWGMVMISVNAAAAPDEIGTNVLEFKAKGVVEAIKPEDEVIVIRHEAISNYMDAMTMPFKVKDRKEILGVHDGEQITFQLHVAHAESWVDQIVKIGQGTLQTHAMAAPVQAPVDPLPNPLLDYKFTNELGQAVSLHDFRGQALAITFFYTRCPLPEYCPRLSKNFQEASQQLASMTNAPANWHFLSISFDTEFDTPRSLKSYGEFYGYDPAHWSFLTGPAEKIGELARSCGANYKSEGGTINHNFRTLIVDATGHLQMMFPTGGNLSGQIVEQILKAAAVVKNEEARNR